MDIWSSIREFYRKWKPEIDLYGIGFLLMGSALSLGKYAAALVIFGGMVIMDIMRRWGEPWRQIGEKEFQLRQQANQEYWRERTAEFLARFQKEPTPPVEPSVTRVISNPARDEDLPESPATILEPEKAVVPVIPPVTHDT